MRLFLLKPTSACLNSIHHKVGLTGKGVSRVYNPVIESVIFFIVLFPELFWPVKSSTNREKLVLESFSKSLSASCYLCCYVYTHDGSQDYREDYSFVSTSGKQLTGHWGCKFLSK